jgi:DNA primase
VFRRYDRDDVLARTDLPKLLDELCGPARGRGRGARWNCPVPDHVDANPSVTVSVGRRGIERWKCWSMGHGGTAVDALCVARGVDYKEAIGELARRVGAVETHSTAQARRRPTRDVEAPRQLAPAAVEYVLATERLLWQPAGRRVLEYLVDERGLDPDVLRANRVGADPGTRTLHRASGLPKAGPGAVFPVLDADGAIAYFQTRYINPGRGHPKYGNPVGELGANPNHGWTHPAGEAHEAVLICEGFPDAYVANTAGYEAVALLGTGNATPVVTSKIARRLGKRPAILALDGDQAGRAAAEHLWTGLRRCGIMVVDLPLPSGTDLNSWVRAAHEVPDLGPLRPIPSPGPAVAPVPAFPTP